MNFISPFKKIICHYCFEKFHLSEAPRRSINFSSTFNDKKLGKFLDRPGIETGPVTNPSEFPLWQKVFNKIMIFNDLKSFRKICPNCHMNLSTLTSKGKFNTNMIAIIGKRGSGKSNYLGVLLNQLCEQYAGEVGFRVIPQESYSVTQDMMVSSSDLYNENYYKYIYENNVAVEASESSRRNMQQRIPLVYRLEFNNKSIDLVFFDAAGEDLEDSDTLDQFYKYIHHAIGVIFLIDPLDFPLLKQKINYVPSIWENPTSSWEEEESDKLHNVIENIANSFYNRGIVSVNKKIKTHFAFAISKLDLFREKINPQITLGRPIFHEGGFNLKKVETQSEDVIGLLHELGGEKVLNLIKRNYNSSNFFAFSALGNSPIGENRKIKSPSPINVADPLLWLLYKTGFIPKLI
jgi:hypothetical protein